MMTMDAGWSDLGGWPSLLRALGAPPLGRVVKPGEALAPGPTDLVLRRRDGRLELVEGIGPMSVTEPVALLSDALAFRPLICALLERVA